MFNPLNENDYAGIAGLMLNEMKEPLIEKGIKLSYDESALKLIAHKAFNKKLGARDIRHVIRNEIEDKIAEILIDKGEGSITGLGITQRDGELAVDAI